MKRFTTMAAALIGLAMLVGVAAAQTSGLTAGFSLTTASTQVLAARGSRRGIIIQNSPLSASAIYCACGVAANSSASPPVGMYIDVGGSWESNVTQLACTTAINCAAISTATCEATDY